MLQSCFFGTPAGTATVVVECLVMALWMNAWRHVDVSGALQPGSAFRRNLDSRDTHSIFLSGIQPYSKAFTPLPVLFLPFLAFHRLVLSRKQLVGCARSRRSKSNNHRSSVWWKNFAWLSVNYFSGAYVAALIVTYTKQLDFSALAIIVPLLVVSYMTFRTAIGRAEDSYHHLAELNRLYLSTIETLAMAIDAKDQITHGHIRRVQSLCRWISKEHRHVRRQAA